jgi:hypothetical protein
MPPEQFEEGFGHEWFIRCGEVPATAETDLFDGLP